MKRQGFLFEKIVDIDNIKLAIVNASKKKRNRRVVAKVLDNIDAKAAEVKALLESGHYKPKPYHLEEITDNSSGKQRSISKPRFYPDQVVHWALMQVIAPILMKSMDDYSLGSIPGRGGAKGFRAVRRWLDRDPANTKYYLQLDIRKYYPSIDQGALKQMLRRYIKDEKCLAILDAVIESVPSGIPIGNYTSQWFANIYLTELDHLIREKMHVKYYARNMDDMVLFGRNKKKLHAVRREISAYLATIKLELKGNWQLYRLSARAVDFLGYRFYRDHTTLRRRTALRIRRRATKVAKKPRLTPKDAAAMVSYKCGMLDRCDCRGYTEQYVTSKLDIERMKGVLRIESRKQRNADQPVRN